MPTLTITDTATPALAQALNMLQDKGPLLGAMAHRLVRDTSAHVRAWGASHPNKLGGRRTNYWSGIAAKINPQDCVHLEGQAATVTLGGPEMPGLMRAFGDVTIVPGTKTPGVKYIPIPARAEAYGTRPGEFGNTLMLFWTGQGRIGGLAMATPLTRTKNTAKGAKGTAYFKPGAVMYWFTKSVTQSQDRSLLPSEAQWSESVNAAAKDWLELELKKRGLS